MDERRVFQSGRYRLSSWVEDSNGPNWVGVREGACKILPTSLTVVARPGKSATEGKAGADNVTDGEIVPADG